MGPLFEQKRQNRPCTRPYFFLRRDFLIFLVASASALILSLHCWQVTRAIPDLRISLANFLSQILQVIRRGNFTLLHQPWNLLTPIRSRLCEVASAGRREVESTEGCEPSGLTPRSLGYEMGPHSQWGRVAFCVIDDAFQGLLTGRLPSGGWLATDGTVEGHAFTPATLAFASARRLWTSTNSSAMSSKAS